MVMDMKNFRWPGILQVEIRCKIRSDGTVLTNPENYDLQCVIGSGFADQRPTSNGFLWGFFTLRLTLPIDLTYIWEGK